MMSEDAGTRQQILHATYEALRDEGFAATTITGDTPCRSTNVDYRLDTASARGFLAQFVTLP